MLQNEPVAKDKTFNLRLDEKDRERLDVIAAHYSAPAATAVRMLIKKEFDQLLRFSRWPVVSEEARRFAKLSEIPNLTVEFDEDSRAIRLSDGKITHVLAGGEGPYFTLATWPGSKLDANVKKLGTGAWSALDQAALAQTEAKAAQPSAQKTKRKKTTR